MLLIIYVPASVTRKAKFYAVFTSIYKGILIFSWSTAKKAKDIKA